MFIVLAGFIVGLTFLISELTPMNIRKNLIKDTTNEYHLSKESLAAIKRFTNSKMVQDAIRDTRHLR